MTNTNETKRSTRRGFALAASIAGAALTGMQAKAQSTTNTEMPANGDIGVLNYALTLEHLEAAFYTQGLARFASSDLSNTMFAGVFGPGTVAGVYNNLRRIRDHEVAHVEALTNAIRSLGGVPVEACSYNFPYATPEEFLKVAHTLEEVGVMAYDGAIALMQPAALRAAGMSIATVEARHAAYLALLNTEIPFPKAFDEAKMMREILAMAAPFITSCGGRPFGMPTTAVLMPKNISTVSQQITLDASQSVSGDGQPLRYNLRLISGAAGITRQGTANPAVQFSGGRGEYTFELTVTDSAGNVSRDRTTIRYAGV